MVLDEAAVGVSRLELLTRAHWQPPDAFLDKVGQWSDVGGAGFRHPLPW
jgi:hypothetical protein